MKIGFYGVTGDYDFGDFAMMCENLKAIGSAAPNAEIAVFTPDTKITDELLNLNINDDSLLSRIQLVDDHLLPTDRNAIEWFARRAVRKIAGYDSYFDAVWNGAKSLLDGKDCLCGECRDALSKCDVLVFNGGGFIQNGWGLHVKVFLAYVLIAKAYGIPVWFLGSSYGPLNDDLLARARIALPLADGILLRDGCQRSVNLLRELDCHNFSFGTDDLMYALEAKSAEKIVAVEFMAWIDRHPKGANWVVGEFARFSRWLLKEGYRVELVCFDKNDAIASEGMMRVWEDCERDPRIHILESVTNVKAVYEIYEKCCFSVSLKYHPMVFSVACSRPCIGFISDSDGYYEGKLNGVFESVGLSPEKRVLPLREISFEVLRDAFLARDDQVLESPQKEGLRASKKKYIDQILRSALAHEDERRICQ